MHYKPAISLLLLFIVLSADTWAQSDFDIWTTIELQKKWKNWDFASTAELRSNGFYSHTDRLSLELEASYAINKVIKVGANYEIIDFYDSKYDDYQLRNRVAGFFQAKQKWGNFTITLSEKFQLTTKDDSDRIKSNGEIDTYKIDPDLVWRNKLKVKYNIPKFPVTPSLSAETFFQLNNPAGYVFEKLRYTLSFDYKIAKHQHIELYGLVNSEIYGNNQGKTYVLGLGYSFTF